MIDVPQTLKGRDFTSIRPWSRAELEHVLDLADDLKVRRATREPTALLPGRTSA